MLLPNPCSLRERSNAELDGATSPVRTALPSSLAGRDSCDYYGPSVTIGLAPRRPSRIPLCARRIERDVGVPVRPLERARCPSPTGREVGMAKVGTI